jgi:hypothetical protein
MRRLTLSGTSALPPLSHGLPSHPIHGLRQQREIADKTPVRQRLKAVYRRWQAASGSAPAIDRRLPEYSLHDCREVRVRATALRACDTMVSLDLMQSRVIQGKLNHEEKYESSTSKYLNP